MVMASDTPAESGRGTEASPPDGPEPPAWQRVRTMLYTLEQIGWRRGEPVMQNRLMITVSGGPSTDPAEVEALAERLLALLTPA